MEAMKQVKIIYPQQEKTFGQRLESLAEWLTSRAQNDNGGDTPASVMERDIKMALSHIAQAKQRHKEMMSNLLRHECYVDTEILQHDFIHRSDYSLYHFRFRGKLQDKLGRIEQERRQSTQAMEDRLQLHHDRLLVLLNRHAMVNP